MSARTCHARGCKRGVAPKMLMCLQHWHMVPLRLQREVWRTYVPGQELRKDPTPEYMAAAKAAIESHGYLALAETIIERADRAQPWRRALKPSIARTLISQLWLALLFEPRTPAAREKLVSRLRRAVFARDRFTCNSCGRSPIHDASVALRLCIDPLATACETCARALRILTPAIAAELAASRS